MARNPYFDDGDSGTDEGWDDAPAAAPSALPEWAQIRADLPGSDAAPAAAPAAPATVPAPVRPARPTLTPPARPTGPVPGLPATSAAPVVPAPVVETPAVVEAAPVAAAPSTPASPAAPVTGETALPPREVPARTAPRSFTPDPLTGGADAPVEAWETTATTSKRRALARTLDRLVAGGRWKLLALRALVWGVLGLLLLGGLTRLLNPSPITTASVVAEVQDALGRGEFPAEAGEQLAAAFTETYLTYYEESRNTRKQTLAAMTADGLADFADGAAQDPGYFQKIVAGPFWADLPLLVDDTHVTYTFAALVADPTTGTRGDAGPIPPRWVYLAVPVAADADGRVAIAAAPAFVPAPERADKLTFIEVVVDSRASEEAAEPVKQFLTEWAKATQAAQVPQQLLTADATPAARNGLGGGYTLVGEPEVVVWTALDGTGGQVADVAVRWQAPGGLTLDQTYQIDVSNDGQYWYVADIRGGSFTGLNR